MFFNSAAKQTPILEEFPLELKLLPCPRTWVFGQSLPEMHYKNGFPVILFVIQKGEKFFLPESDKKLPSAEVFAGERVGEGIRRVFTHTFSISRRDIPPYELCVMGHLQSDVCERARRVFLIRLTISTSINFAPRTPGSWCPIGSITQLLSGLVAETVFFQGEDTVIPAAA